MSEPNPYQPPGDATRRPERLSFDYIWAVGYGLVASISLFVFGAALLFVIGFAIDPLRSLLVEHTIAASVFGGVVCTGIGIAAGLHHCTWPTPNRRGWKRIQVPRLRLSRARPAVTILALNEPTELRSTGYLHLLAIPRQPHPGMPLRQHTQQNRLG